MYSRILVPVDLDNADKLDRALAVAAQMAKAHGAPVAYVDVVDAVPTTSARTEGARAAAAMEAFAAQQAERFGIETSGHVTLRGDLHLTVGSDVIRAAQTMDCDLIVMGSHVPGLKDFFLPSNAGHVAAHAPVSVFVVR